MKETCSHEYPAETGLAVIEQSIIRMKESGWEKTSVRTVMIVEFERELTDPPSAREHPAFGTRCYVCQEKIIGGEFAWDKHFQEKHPSNPLPSAVFQSELDSGIHQ